MKKITLVLTLLHCCAIGLFAQNKTQATINHVALYVVNINASSAFYKNIIGLDTIPEPFHDGRHCWLKIGNNIAMHLIAGADIKKEYYKNNHLCFSVASVTAFTKSLEKNKLNWEDGTGKVRSITTRVDGVHQLWLQDPDGYWIEINDAKF